MHIIQQALEPREKLIWSGQPKQGIVFRRTDLFLVPFSLFWCGFAIFWEFTAFNSGASVFFLLFGGVFVVIGLNFVLGRFFWDSSQRKKTFYGITNERIIIVDGFVQRNITSLNIHALPEVSLSERSDGLGTILLGSQSATQRGTTLSGAPKGVPKLDLIKDPKYVFSIIRSAQKR
ncbi:PH domain-containing protein [Vibrio barjaei]|jgi:hypothetical protein|uniref:PH domain-containing protein n=1 Tax=Vibrio barjaei TaxID=1676683 RepID=UPI0007BBA270|nr:PH domain-containing protein [Vibrio barjaei]OIN23248.1 hypothetical protein AWH66_2020890 [Vibrio barjaei]